MRDQSLSERLHMDVPLLLGLTMLCAIGLITLYSAGGQEAAVVLRQFLRMLLAFGLMVLVAQFPPGRLARWSVPLYGIGLLLLVLVLMIGEVGKGAQRWLDLGVFRFQPSELAKLAVPMAVAWLLAQRELPPSLPRVFAAGVLILIPVLLIAKQPDLGTAVIVAVAGFSVLFVGGMSWRLIGAAVLLAAASAPTLWYLMHDYQRRRVHMFLDPEQDPLGSGYHIIQSKIAIGSGGLYGKGWLNGTQSHLDFLPERSTDFIFAVYCEEFGLMGVLLLIAIYALIIARGLYLALYSQEVYGRLLGCGIMLTFFAYMFVNMGMVVGQLPVVGIPLPLISHGGTSLVTLLAGFGMVMSVHSHRRLLSEKVG
ncbi:MAG: rod shape-determining protein RodA [Gammaproteobacteria bacterium]|nr:rod shape-determining protein RodA [Gammaproteobacteria bacterium]